MDDYCTTCHFNRNGFCQRFPPQVTLYPSDNQLPVLYVVGDGFPAAVAGRWCGEWLASTIVVAQDRGGGPWLTFRSSSARRWCAP